MRCAGVIRAARRCAAITAFAVAASAAFAALAACAPAATSVDVKTRVAVTITPSPDRLPFDPRSARISQAAQEVTTLAGHPMTLDVDAAIVPEFRSSFEEAIGQSFENMARDLVDLRDRSPREFAYGAGVVSVVSLRYDATADGDRWDLDVGARTLFIRGPARRDTLVGRGVLRESIHKAYAQSIAGRYAFKREMGATGTIGTV